MPSRESKRTLSLGFSPFEAEAGALGWGELIREVAEKTEPIRPQEGWIGLIARNLFLLLAHKTKGKAQVLVRHVPDQNGLEALRMDLPRVPTSREHFLPTRCSQPSSSQDGGTKLRIHPVRFQMFY